MNPVYAQDINVDNTMIRGPLVGINNLGDIINVTLKSLLIPMASVILLFVIIWGGYDFMMSRGDPGKIKSGKAKLTTGIIGFFLLIFSYLAVTVLSKMFGFGGEIFK
jgi:cation transporter-like permease